MDAYMGSEVRGKVCVCVCVCTRAHARFNSMKQCCKCVDAMADLMEFSLPLWSIHSVGNNSWELCPSGFPFFVLSSTLIKFICLLSLLFLLKQCLLLYRHTRKLQAKLTERSISPLTQRQYPDSLLWIVCKIQWNPFIAWTFHVENSILWVNSMSRDTCATSFLMAEWCPIVQMHHRYCSQSPSAGHQLFLNFATSSATVEWT